MNTYTMELVYRRTKQCGDTTVSVAVYYPDLGEDGNELPGLYSVCVGDHERWVVHQGGPEGVKSEAMSAFERTCDEAEADYHESGRARDDYRLMVAGL